MTIQNMIIKAGLLIIVLFISGCADNNVEGVRGGTINGYESTTIGQAFDAAFDNATWGTFETAKGQMVVEFNGLISVGLRNNVLDLLMESYKGFTTREDLSQDMDSQNSWVVGAPVKVQWLIHINGEEFELLAMQSQAWENVDIDNILGIIYR